MIISAGDLNIELDTGFGSKHEVLHRLVGGRCVVFKIKGKLVRHPVDIQGLPPGKYRMIVSGWSSYP